MSTTLRYASAAAVTLWLLVFSTAFLPADERIELKKALMQATIRAIELETGGYKGKLETAEAGTGPKENVEKFRKRLEDLAAERERFSRLKPEQYPEPGNPEPGAGSIIDQSARFGPVLPPTPREVSVAMDAPCSEGSLLTVQGASRAGPFYHLAGITGGDYGILKPGRSYRLTVFRVYKREYFGLIDDSYVYVAAVR